MNKLQLRDEIEGIIMQIGKPNDEKEQFSIENFLLNLDSLKFIELVTAIENRYQITMSSDDLMLFKTGKISVIMDAAVLKINS